jgi:hypothetical protein
MQGAEKIPKVPIIYISFDKPKELKHGLDNLRDDKKKEIRRKADSDTPLPSFNEKSYNKVKGILIKIREKAPTLTDEVEQTEAFLHLSVQDHRFFSYPKKIQDLYIRLEVQRRRETKRISEINRESATRLAYQLCVAIINNTALHEVEENTQDSKADTQKSRDFIGEKIIRGGGVFIFNADEQPSSSIGGKF